MPLLRARLIFLRKAKAAAVSPRQARVRYGARTWFPSRGNAEARASADPA